jgi:hypothetical protein
MFCILEISLNTHTHTLKGITRKWKWQLLHNWVNKVTGCIKCAECATALITEEDSQPSQSDHSYSQPSSSKSSLASFKTFGKLTSPSSSVLGLVQTSHFACVECNSYQIRRNYKSSTPVSNVEFWKCRIQFDTFQTSNFACVELKSTRNALLLISGM